MPYNSEEETYLLSLINGNEFLDDSPEIYSLRLEAIYLLIQTGQEISIPPETVSSSYLRYLKKLSFLDFPLRLKPFQEIKIIKTFGLSCKNFLIKTRLKELLAKTKPFPSKGGRGFIFETSLI